MTALKNSMEDFCKQGRRDWPGTQYSTINQEIRMAITNKTQSEMDLLKGIKVDYDIPDQPAKEPTAREINRQNVRMFCLDKAMASFDYKNGVACSSRFVKDAKEFEQYILGE